MSELDFSQAYSVVHGGAPARYEQHGRYFDSELRPLQYDVDKGAFIRPEEKVLTERFDLEAVLGDECIEELHHLKIRNLVMKCGGTFTSKAQGITYLKQYLEHVSRAVPADSV